MSRPANRSMTDATRAQLHQWLGALVRSRESSAPMRVLFITGAGLSAASGVPTFRGPEGYWTVGSVEYRPEQLATYAAFRRMRAEVWRWYLYRHGVCNAAAPNAAHRAIAALQTTPPAGLHAAVLSQNVDGLHRRAGSPVATTYEVHGHINSMRVHALGSAAAVLPIPDDVPALARDEPLPDAVLARLCDAQGRATRPHILWFDESYDESLYRFESALREASQADLVVVVGTSGAAAAPYHACQLALRNGARLLDVNTDDGPFSELAASLDDTTTATEQRRGVVLRGPADPWVPTLCELLRHVLGASSDLDGSPDDPRV